MPRRDDIKRILLIGSGPIVIGQACEFDYSGTQACKALREEGYEVVLINSNPATIMTDPSTADRTYIEPLTWEIVEKVIEKERPDALLPTLGGQTALNLAMALEANGVLKKYGVEMIGANADVIDKAESRERFKQAMAAIGLDTCRGETVTTIEQARALVEQIGLPAVVRPSFTMGGSGSAIAYNRHEFDELVLRGLDMSPTTQVLIEESIIGWKEYEMEVMRDVDDNVVIICSIENFDPMGVHTGDSITVAPAQTLSDKEYQRMRDASLAVIREIGVETGGSNIQFAINPLDGRMIVIEMNPRVSRSSALASKATGFPIAKIAAKLAVGYRLHELPNDITRVTTACFEPTIDYVVTKAPRFAFEKFPEADDTLTTQMKSVGETMAIGSTFKESFQKALRGLEVGSFGFGCDGIDQWGTDEQPDEAEIRAKLARPCPQRVWHIRYAFKSGMTVKQIHELSGIDPWFLDNLLEIVETEDRLRATAWEALSAELLRTAKRFGFSDRQLAVIFKRSETEIRTRRLELGIRAVYKSVDTCAAEFEAYTPYYYSTYETPVVRVGPGGSAQIDDEIRISDRKKIVILGGGPNRIGQGIEFDYCCVHAAFAADELGFESVMVNSNPETVSTDYDTSDMLFFEPLTHEDVLNICERLNGGPLKKASTADSATSATEGLLLGVIVQFGGQTPLNLAKGLHDAGVPIIGTSVDSIDMAEDRKRFAEVLEELQLKSPESGTATTVEGARKVAAKIGYPVLVRPSYVLGGRAMEIVSDEKQLDLYMARAVDASTVGRDHPILIDRFLGSATEVDVDCLADYGPRPDGSDEPNPRAIICGVMEHIEEAGIHSGDSACSLPPFSLKPQIVAEIQRQTRLLAQRLKVRGLMNIQFAVKEEQVYILEVNPRASRTVPFVSKATGVPWAKLAAKVMAGKGLAELGVTDPPRPKQVSVKESVFPFTKFPGVDVILGPEMRSTGEVMGVDMSFGIAFAKSQMAAGSSLPTGGTVFISVCEADKKAVVSIGKRLAAMGFDLVATGGTAAVFVAAGVACRSISKMTEGRPNIGDMVTNGDCDLIINTPTARGPKTDEGRIRGMATLHNIPLITTITGADAACKAIEALRENREGDAAHGDGWTVRPLQEYFPQKKK